MPVRFDDSLPILTKLLASRFGKDALDRAVVIREAGGRLSVMMSSQVAPAALAAAEAEIRKELGAYARPERAIADIDSPGARRLLEEASNLSSMKIGEYAIRLLDRRIIGSDWLRPPAEYATKIPRVIFGSLKGGVGRSTALCVLAAHLSRRGRRVLAVDFDLEAPGLGTMLLPKRELPKFGTLDYLVENGLSGIDDRFVADLAAGSVLGSEGARVTVVPAIGQRTIENPADALSKIARAYLEDFTEDGRAISLSEQLREMVERFEATDEHDIVLVDVRAGLHETAAAALLALGGEILLFGADQPQTFVGYRLLMAHLSRFPINPSDDWRERIRFVHAKAPDSEEKIAAADERFSSLYELIVREEDSAAAVDLEELTAEDFDLTWAEGEDHASEQYFEPPPVMHILDDARYRDFDPIVERVLLAPTTYAATFRELLDYGDTIANVGLSEELARD